MKWEWMEEEWNGNGNGWDRQLLWPYTMMKAQVVGYTVTLIMTLPFTTAAHIHANDIGSMYVPVVITDCPPDSSEVHFHPSRFSIRSICKSDSRRASDLSSCVCVSVTCVCACPSRVCVCVSVTCVYVRVRVRVHVYVCVCAVCVCMCVCACACVCVCVCVQHVCVRHVCVCVCVCSVCVCPSHVYVCVHVCAACVYVYKTFQ